MALHPTPERLLTGLVNIVPELTKPGEPQSLVGHPARPVIDHEDKAAGEQQEPQKSKNTPDHAPPYTCAVRNARAIAPVSQEIKHFISFSDRRSSLPACPVSVDAAIRRLYKGANGGGRNPAAAVL
jgi:hypothetical protein